MSVVRPATRKLTPAGILHRLNTRFEGYRLRADGLGRVLAFWIFVASVLGLVVLFAWIDLVLELPPELRVLLLVTAFFAPIVIAVIVFRRHRARHGIHEITRSIDDRIASGGEVTTGFDLAKSKIVTDKKTPNLLTRGLSLIAVHRAANLLLTTQPHKALSGRDLYRWFGVVVALAFMLTGVSVLMPRLAWTQVVRFMDPWGDHPPYTRLSFQLDPENASVNYGSPLDIVAIVDGPNPEQMELVLDSRPEGSHGKIERQVIPMFDISNRMWRASLTQVTAPATYYVRSGSSRSHRHEIEVIYVPRIEEVKTTIHPPVYTRRPDYEGPVPYEGFSGLVGTQVSLTVKSNRPLIRGEMAIYSADNVRQLPMIVLRDHPNTVQGTFDLKEPGRIEVHVYDQSLTRSEQPYQAPITIQEDRAPFVRLIEPRTQSYATPDAMLPVVIAAEDDYGLSRIQLFRNLNDSPYRPQEVELDGTPLMANQAVILPLAAYRLQPGDEIRLFARVRDNDPRAGEQDSENAAPWASDDGGKGAESEVVVVRIIDRSNLDQMQQRRETLDSLVDKYQQAERRLEKLKDQLQALQKKLAEAPADQPLTPQQKDELEQLQKQINEELAALERLAQREMPFDLDQELNPSLKRLIKRMKDAKESLDQSEENPEQNTVQNARRKLDRLAHELGESQQEFEEASKPSLEKLQKIFPLKEDEAKFEDLAQRQRDLAERSKALKDKQQPDAPDQRSQFRELSAEQKNLREELADLTRKLQEDTDALPDTDEYRDLKQSAQQFTDELKKSNAGSEMGEAEQQLAQFDGPAGSKSTNKAARSLEDLMPKAEGVGAAASEAAGQGKGEGGERFAPGSGSGSSLSKTMEQLLKQSGLGKDRGSSQRGKGPNVGLYGSDPQQNADMAKEAPKSGDRETELAGGPASNGLLPNSRDGGMSLRRKTTTGGATDIVIPPRYRERVGRYFQQLADELEQR